MQGREHTFGHARGGVTPFEHPHDRGIGAARAQLRHDLSVMPGFQREPAERVAPEAVITRGDQQQVGAETGQGGINRLEQIGDVALRR